MATQHFIKVKGIKYYSSMFGGFDTKNEIVDFITILSDYQFKTLQEKTEQGKPQYIGGLGALPIVFDNDDFTLYSVIVKVNSWRICEDDEIERYHSVFKSNNMEIKTMELNLYRDERVEERTYLCHIDKDLFPIVFNGKKMTYKEFKEMAIENDTKVLHTFDNGYSHWGEYTGKFENVEKHIEKVFGEYDAFFPLPFHSGKAFAGEHYGWNYTNKGALIINTTKKDVNVSYVSNS